MQHIATVPVGLGGAASITFSAIPDTFTDLVLVTSLRSTRINYSDLISLKINGVVTNQSSRVLQGEGSSASSFSLTTLRIAGATGVTATSNTFANSTTYFPNYRSNVAKSISTDAVTENNATASDQFIIANLWNDTSAITSLEIFSVNSGNFVQYSSASLYGITAGSDGIVSVS